MNMNRESRRLLIARPRGFCAGVDRAIAIVEAMLEQVEGTLYVRREIVHNRSVVDYFSERGVVFVEELDEVPAGSSVIFSAHGVSPAVREDAERRGLQAIDATCPLVSKVHHQVRTRAEAGNHILLIGHRGHDEVTGTMGVAPGGITLVSSAAEVENLEIPDGSRPYYVTQTTLSVDETREIVEALRVRFPDLDGPVRSDICYATQNRQDAVKSLVAGGIELLLVVGSPNSSNSLRLCEVARGMAVPAETRRTGIPDLPGTHSGRIGSRVSGPGNYRRLIWYGLGIPRNRCDGRECEIQPPSVGLSETILKSLCIESTQGIDFDMTRASHYVCAPVNTVKLLDMPDRILSQRSHRGKEAL